MRAVDVTASALATMAVVGSVGTATPAHASNYGVELNGTYRVTSNGDWAQANQVFIDEQTAGHIDNSFQTHRPPPRLSPLMVSPAVRWLTAR